VGHVLRNPALARTLEIIANEGAETFYRGTLAKAWTTEAAKLGVKITAEDVANYKVRVDTPIEYKVFGLRAQTTAPSSASGIMVAGTLRFLEHYYATHEVP